MGVAAVKGPNFKGGPCKQPPRLPLLLRSPAAHLPHAPHWDSTFSLLADPYRFIGATCNALRSDVFETRLMLQPTVCMRGAQAAALFYDPQRFTRVGAAPEPVQATLFGKGAVQGLDGLAHQHRKALFMQVTAPAHVAHLVTCTRTVWHAMLPAWQQRGTVALYYALQPVLTMAVCEWAGVPLPVQDVARRMQQLSALFDAAASGPLQHLRARWARWRAQAWLAGLIAQARAGRITLAPGSAAHAVELLNLLRPVVAVSLYMTLAAHALHAYPA
jgi:fatty-acid peroxygenase